MIARNVTAAGFLFSEIITAYCTKRKKKLKTMKSRKIDIETALYPSCNLIILNELF